MMTNDKNNSYWQFVRAMFVEKSEGGTNIALALADKLDGYAKDAQEAGAHVLVKDMVLAATMVRFAQAIFIDALTMPEEGEDDDH